MAERSRPWSGIVTGDAGPYSDDQWTDVWRSLLAPIIARQGVFQEQLNEFDLSSVAADPVSVASGRAMVNGIWYESDAATSVTIPTPAANPRVDRIVARADWVLQTVRITRIAGAEAASPVPPALVQVDGTTWDLPLWQVHATTGGVLTFFADDRIFIGQYEPAASSDDHWFLEDEMFFGQQGAYAASENFKDFRLTIAGSYDATPSTVFGTGVLNLAANGAGTGFVSYTTGLMDPEVTNNRSVIMARNPNSDANLDRLIGYASLVGDVTPTDGVMFRAVGAGNWFAVCREGGVEFTVDTTLAPDATNRKFEIRQVIDEAVVFLIDDVVRAQINTNVNSLGAMAFGVQIVDSGVNPVDQIYMQADRIKATGTRPA